MKVLEERSLKGERDNPSTPPRLFRVIAQQSLMLLKIFRLALSGLNLKPKIFTQRIFFLVPAQ
jgi:hypothetical protein